MDCPFTRLLESLGRVYPRKASLRETEYEKYPYMRHILDSQKAMLKGVKCRNIY